MWLYADTNGEVEGLSHDGIPTKFSIKFEDILAFATGATSEPPMGFFEQPSLNFQSSSPFPRANTCTNVIHLPLRDMPFTNFVYYMTHGILNSAGFGLI